MPLKSSHTLLTEVGKKTQIKGHEYYSRIPFPPDPCEEVSEISRSFYFSAFTQTYCIASLELKIQVKSQRSYDVS